MVDCIDTDVWFLLSIFRTQSLKTPVRNTSTASASNSSAQNFVSYGNVESRVVETAPPQVPSSEQDVDQNKAEGLEMEEKHPSMNGPVITVEPQQHCAPGLLLKDLDEEEDMMKDESDTSSEPDLEWQVEPLETVSQTEVAVDEHEPEESETNSVEESGTVNGFQYVKPLVVTGSGEVDNDNDDEEEEEVDLDEELVIPPGCVRIEVSQQPTPPSPIEVSSEDAMSLSPPPPPPEIVEDEAEADEDLPSPPSEPLPSPPPEPLPAVTLPEMLPSPPPEPLPLPPPETLPSPPPEVLEDQTKFGLVQLSLFLFFFSFFFNDRHLLTYLQNFKIYSKLTLPYFIPIKHLILTNDITVLDYNFIPVAFN